MCGQDNGTARDFIAELKCFIKTKVKDLGWLKDASPIRDDYWRIKSNAVNLGVALLDKLHECLNRIELLTNIIEDFCDKDPGTPGVENSKVADSQNETSHPVGSFENMTTTEQLARIHEEIWEARRSGSRIIRLIEILTATIAQNSAVVSSNSNAYARLTEAIIALDMSETFNKLIPRLTENTATNASGEIPLYDMPLRAKGGIDTTVRVIRGDEVVSFQIGEFYSKGEWRKIEKPEDWRLTEGIIFLWYNNFEMSFSDAMPLAIKFADGRPLVLLTEGAVRNMKAVDRFGSSETSRLPHFMNVKDLSKPPESSRPVSATGSFPSFQEIPANETRASAREVLAQVKKKPKAKYWYDRNKLMFRNKDNEIVCSEGEFKNPPTRALFDLVKEIWDQIPNVDLMVKGDIPTPHRDRQLKIRGLYAYDIARNEFIDQSGRMIATKEDKVLNTSRYLEMLEFYDKPEFSDDTEVMVKEPPLDHVILPNSKVEKDFQIPPHAPKFVVEPADRVLFNPSVAEKLGVRMDGTIVRGRYPEGGHTVNPIVPTPGVEDQGPGPLESLMTALLPAGSLPPDPNCPPVDVRPETPTFPPDDQNLFNPLEDQRKTFESPEAYTKRMWDKYKNSIGFLDFETTCAILNEAVIDRSPGMEASNKQPFRPDSLKYTHSNPEDFI